MTVNIGGKQCPEVVFIGGPYDGTRIAILDGKFPMELYVGLAGDGGSYRDERGHLIMKVASDEWVCRYEFDASGDDEIEEFDNGLMRIKTASVSDAQFGISQQQPRPDVFVIRNCGAPK